MKQVLLILILCLGICNVSAQKKSSTEKVIRDLEQLIVNAILKDDTNSLKTLWAAEYIVNTPRNDIAPDRRAVLNNQKAGLIDYSIFERIIENIQIQKNLATTMGYEILVFKSNPNQQIKRRFTNIWRKKNGKWQQIARHASIICG